MALRFSHGDATSSPRNGLACPAILRADHEGNVRGNSGKDLHPPSWGYSSADFLGFVSVGPVRLFQPIPLVVEEDAGLFVEVENLGEGKVARARTSSVEMLGELVTEHLHGALGDQRLAGREGAPLRIRHRERPGQNGLDVAVRALAAV